MGNHHSTTCTENNRDYQSKGTLEPSDVKPGSYLHEADKDYQSNGTLECVPSEVQLRSYSDEAVEGMVSDYQSKGTLECVPSEVQLRSYSDEAVESMVSGYQSKGALEHVPGDLEMVSCSAGGMVSGKVLWYGTTVEALVSNHLRNSEKWLQLEVVAYENGLS